MQGHNPTAKVLVVSLAAKLRSLGGLLLVSLQYTVSQGPQHRYVVSPPRRLAVGALTANSPALWFLRSVCGPSRCGWSETRATARVHHLALRGGGKPPTGSGSK